tara:strand:- start:542 stop:1288 length:747 start_codon:yes stop_codon:yes gene_type:complete
MAAKNKYNILKVPELDLSNIKYSPIKALDNGAKVSYINYKTDNNPIRLQTTECELPFDAGYYADAKKNCGKYSIKISLRDSEEFSEKIKEFDAKIKEDAMKNSKEWFKKAKMTSDAIDAMYTNMLRESTDVETGEIDGKYPPQFTYKVVIRDGKCECRFFDETKTKIEVEDLTSEDISDHSLSRKLVKGAKIKALLKCNGIWVSGSKFGCTWRAEQIQISVPEDLDEFAFRESDEEDTFIESDDDDSD